MITFTDDAQDRTKQRSGSIKARPSGSNEDLNSSLKKEIDQSNISTPKISSSSTSPNKFNKRKSEISRRIDSNDSENKSSQRNTSLRKSYQIRKSSNDPNELSSITENPKKKTLQQK